MSHIVFLPYTNYNEAEIIALYKSVGWSNYYKNPALLKNAYANSLYILGAYHKEKLVGIIRVVGDNCSIIYIQDILILPEYQHQRIGTKLVSTVLDKYKSVHQKILLTDNTEKATKFYESLGFSNVADLGCLAFQFFAK